MGKPLETTAFFKVAKTERLNIISLKNRGLFLHWSKKSDHVRAKVGGA